MDAAGFRAWKRRRRAKNAEIAALTGYSISAIDKMLNGRTKRIERRLQIALANIDRLIARRELPENCPDRLARLIVAGRLR